MEKIHIILLLLFLNSCAVSPYNCPNIDEQFKHAHHKDMKNLDRKKYKFKKPIPNAEKREEFGTDED
jgi:hypothetical protein